MNAEPSADVDMHDEAVRCLKEHGVNFGSAYHQASDSAKRILVVNAVNWAAKKLDRHFYCFKHPLMVDAAIRGADSGVVLQRNVDAKGRRMYDIYHPEIGCMTFHDPQNKMEALMLGKEHCMNIVDDKFAWTRMSRASNAFRLLHDQDLLNQMAQITRPQFHKGFVAKEGARRSVLVHSTSSPKWYDCLNTPRISSISVGWKPAFSRG